MRMYNKVRKAVFEAMGIDDNGESLSVTFHSDNGAAKDREFFDRNKSEGDDIDWSNPYLILNFRSDKLSHVVNHLTIFSKIKQEGVEK